MSFLFRSREEQRRRKVVEELVTKMVHERAGRWLTERVASKVASQEEFIRSFEDRERHSLAQTLERDLPRCHFTVVNADGVAVGAGDRKEKVLSCRRALESHFRGDAKALVLMANQGLFGVFLEALHDQFPPDDDFGPVPTPGSQRGPRFEVDFKRGKLMASAACDLRLLGHDRGVFVATFVCDFVVDATKRAVVVRCRRTDDFRTSTAQKPPADRAGNPCTFSDVLDDLVARSFLKPTTPNFFDKNAENLVVPEEEQQEEQTGLSGQAKTTGNNTRCIVTTVKAPPPIVANNKITPRHACSCF